MLDPELAREVDALWMGECLAGVSTATLIEDQALALQEVMERSGWSVQK